MVTRLGYEPFPRSGTFVNDWLGLWSGWACPEGTFSDCMPVWNEEHDILLLFSGEEFTESGDLDRLATRGHGFERHNASYLVHLYEELGPGFLEGLNGIFCGLIADFRQKNIILF